MSSSKSETVTLDGILSALETETAKLDSLQSLCGVVAECADTFSGMTMTGAVFAIMNSVEATKERLGCIVHQLITLERAQKGAAS